MLSCYWQRFLPGRKLLILLVYSYSEDVYINMGKRTIYLFSTRAISCSARHRCGGNSEPLNNLPANPAYPGRYRRFEFDISDISLSLGFDIWRCCCSRRINRKRLDPVTWRIGDHGNRRWNGEFRYTTFLINLLPAWNIVKKYDATPIAAIRMRGYRFHFDVSKKFGYTGG